METVQGTTPDDEAEWGGCTFDCDDEMDWDILFER